MSFEPVMPPFNASDPTASFLSSSCLDFLLIELVPLAYRVTRDRDAPLGPPASTAAAAAASNLASSSLLNSPASTSAPADAASTSHAAASSNAAGVAVSAAGTRKVDDEEDLDAVQYRLETLGYRVGQGLVERSAKIHTGNRNPSLPLLDDARLLTGEHKPTNRFSKDRPRFNDTLDVIKFLCKDLWSLVFGKNIDNLKTNHRVG